MSLIELKNQIKTVQVDFSLIPDDEKLIFQKYKIFPIGILVKADWNYKEDNEATAEKLRNNIKRNGQVENIQVRELETGYYEVVNGNHRLDELIKLGKSNVIAYDHGRISLPEAQRIAIETNETRFNSNLEKLSLLLNDLKIEFSADDLINTLPYDAEELEDLFNMNLDPSVSVPPTVDAEEDDFNMEPPPIPKTSPKDLYELNGHRLFCGDSTKADDVAFLMNGQKAQLVYTDPPYNIAYTSFNESRGEGGRNWNEEYASEWEDSMSDSDYKTFLFMFLKLAKTHSIDHAHFYVWHATTYYRELLDAFEQAEIPYDKVPIQWVKQNAPLSWVHYKRKSEPCMFGGKGAVNGAGNGARWFGPNNEVNIWEISRDPSGSYVHPTQKPIALAARALRNSSQEGELVLDMFLGSGTTLIASDMYQRKCYGMEMEPKFCDVIVQRFMKYCDDNDLECEVKLNGSVINKDYFSDEHTQNN